MLLMMTIQRYQDDWGIGDYRIDSADVSNALPQFLSEGPCPHDPFAAVLNRFDMKAQVVATLMLTHGWLQHRLRSG